MWKAPIYRKSYKKRYGSRCYLRPKNQTYPICKKGKIDCKALHAASYYIRLNHEKKLKKKLATLKRKYCRIVI